MFIQRSYFIVDINSLYKGITLVKSCFTFNLKYIISKNLITSACAYLREIAQFGRAPALEAGGRRFKSCFPDWISNTLLLIHISMF